MSVWMFSSIVGQSLPSAAVEFAFGSWPSEGIVKPRRPQGIHLPETQDEPYRIACQSILHRGLSHDGDGIPLRKPFEDIAVDHHCCLPSEVVTPWNLWF